MTHPQAPARPDEPRAPEIPPEVMKAAVAAYIAYCNEQSRLTQSPTEDELLTVAARAIMTATAAQRERDAKIAVARSDHKRAHCDDACVCDNGYHVALAIERGS